jgi:hypothetical protein
MSIQAEGLSFRMHKYDHHGHSQAAPATPANPIEPWVFDIQTLLAVQS